MTRVNTLAIFGNPGSIMEKDHSDQIQIDTMETINILPNIPSIRYDLPVYQHPTYPTIYAEYQACTDEPRGMGGPSYIHIKIALIAAAYNIVKWHAINKPFTTVKCAILRIRYFFFFFLKNH